MIRCAMRHQPRFTERRDRSRSRSRQRASTTQEDVAVIQMVALRWASHVAKRPSLSARIDADNTFAVTAYRTWAGNQKDLLLAGIELPSFREIFEELKSGGPEGEEELDLIGCSPSNNEGPATRSQSASRSLSVPSKLAASRRRRLRLRPSLTQACVDDDVEDVEDHIAAIRSSTPKMKPAKKMALEKDRRMCDKEATQCEQPAEKYRWRLHTPVKLARQRLIMPASKHAAVAASRDRVDQLRRGRIARIGGRLVGSVRPKTLPRQPNRSASENDTKKICSEKRFDLGSYTVVWSNVPVNKTASRNADTEFTHVDCGTVVNVVEVLGNLEQNRVRARIKSPAGWISLYNTKTGQQFAVPQMELVKCWLETKAQDCRRHHEVPAEDEVDRMPGQKPDVEENSLEGADDERPMMDKAEDGTVPVVAEAGEPEERASNESREEKLPLPRKVAKALAKRPAQSPGSPLAKRPAQSLGSLLARRPAQRLGSPHHLLGMWQGMRNRETEIYNVYLSGKRWECERKGRMRKVFPLRQDGGYMIWGTNYFCKLVDVATKGTVNWYRCTDVLMQSISFSWKRYQGKSPSARVEASVGTRIIPDGTSKDCNRERASVLEQQLPAAEVADEEEQMDLQNGSSSEEFAQKLSEAAEFIASAPPTHRLLPASSCVCVGWLLRGECTASNCDCLHGEEMSGNESRQPSQLMLLDDTTEAALHGVLGAFSKELMDPRCLIVGSDVSTIAKVLGKDSSCVIAVNVDPNVVACNLSGLSVQSSVSYALEVANLYGIEFGCVYLNYSWPLDRFEREAGYLNAAITTMTGMSERHIKAQEVLCSQLEEFDGFHDVKRLFGLDPTTENKGFGPSVPLLSDKGALLVVSVAQPNIAEQRVRLATLIKEAGGKINRQVLFIGEAKPKNKDVVVLVYAVGMPLQSVQRADRNAVRHGSSFYWRALRRN